MLNSWEDVSLEMYLELIDVIKDDSYDDDETKSFEIVSILLDKSLEDVEDMDYLEFNKALRNISFMNEPIKSHNCNVIKLAGTKLELINFKDLEFGAFIDLEHYFTDNYLNNLPIIFSILYRQVVTPTTALNKAVLEPYGSWLDIRPQLLEKVPITSLYEVLTKYIDFRQGVYSSYKGMFQGDEEQLTEQEEKEIISNMTTKERQEYEQEKRVGKWSWTLMLLKLANNDVTNIDKAASMKVFEALNLLAMKQELNIA